MPHPLHRLSVTLVLLLLLWLVPVPALADPVPTATTDPSPNQRLFLPLALLAADTYLSPDTAAAYRAHLKRFDAMLPVPAITDEPLTYRGRFDGDTYHDRLTLPAEPSRSAGLDLGDLPSTLMQARFDDAIFDQLPDETRLTHVQAVSMPALARLLPTNAPAWLRDGLLPSLGDTLALFQGEEPGLSGLALLLTVEDSAAFDEAIDTLVRTIGGEPVPLDQPADTHRRWLVEWRGVPIAVGRRDGHAAASLQWNLVDLLTGTGVVGGRSAQIGFNAVDALRPKMLPLMKEPVHTGEVQALMAEHSVAGDQLVGLYAVDPVNAVHQMLMLIDEAEADAPPLPDAPAFATVQAHLRPAVGILWTDKQGLHYAGRGPFPLAPLIAALDPTLDEIRLAPLLRQ